MCFLTSRFANISAQIKHIFIMIIFSHLKLWLAVARHNFKCVKIKINKDKGLIQDCQPKGLHVSRASEEKHCKNSPCLVIPDAGPALNLHWI